MEASVYIFERSRGGALDQYQIRVVERAAIGDSSVENVANQIQELILSGDLTEDQRSSAYFTLGKLFEPKLKLFFQDRLKVEVNCNPAAVYQLLIALDNLGESVFGADRDGSYSYDQSELNTRDAIKYVHRIT